MIIKKHFHDIFSAISIVVVIISIFTFNLYGQNSTVSEAEILQKLIEEKKFDEAINFIESTEPVMKKYDFYKTSAEFFMKTDKYLRAIDYFKLAFINAGGSKEKDYTLLKRGECYINLRNYNEAKLILYNLIKNNPNTFYLNDAYLLLAQTYEALGDGKEAINYYQKVQPTISAQIVKAKAYVRLNKYDEAIKIFESIIKTEKQVFSNNPDIYYYYAEALRNKSRFKEAKTYLAGAKRINGFSEKASLSLGLIAYAEKDFQPAINYLNEVLRGNDRESKAEALYYLGKIHLEMGQKSEAMEKFVNLRNNFPVSKKYLMATIHLIALSREAKDYKSSIKYIDELLIDKNYNDDLISEIDLILNELLQKDENNFKIAFDKYYPYLVHAKRFGSLIKYSERLNDEKRISVLNKVFLATSGEDKKKSATILFEHYLKKGDLTKALAYEKFVDKSLTEKIKMYDYLFDGNYERALAIIEKTNQPTLDDLDNLFYIEKRISNKNRVKNVLSRWFRRDDLNWEFYNKMGDYYFDKDQKLASESYKRAISKNIGNEAKKNIEKKILALQNNEKLPIESKEKLDEIFVKIREQEKRVEKIVKEYGL